MSKEKGTTYCAVVKYRVDATDAQKRAEIRDGLGFAAAELVALGMSLDDVREALDEAAYYAEQEADAVAQHKN